MSEKHAGKGILNKNFLLLWQAQLISDMGNAAFGVALGFWVLDVTGSNSLMGLILACFAVPRVVLGPFAGAFADRFDRKLIIVMADLIRGILFVLMGILILTRNFPFLLIIPFALLTGFFGAFFTPAIASIVPDIVDKESLTKANSARGISNTASQLVGNSFGGFIYSLLKGPVFFVFNGLSFIYAAVSQLFIRIPKKMPVKEKTHIIHDMMVGFRFSWENKGIKILLLTGMFINFFSTMAVTLLTPLFKFTPGFGEKRYGFVMGSLMIGTILGMIMLSAVKMKPEHRFNIYRSSIFMMLVCMITAVLIKSFEVIIVGAFITGILNAVVSIITQTVIMFTVPEANRGKVFGIMSTIFEGLMPVAMALSGFVAELLGVQGAIIGAFSMAGVAVMPSLFNREFKDYMNSPDEVGNQVSADEPA